MGVQNPNSTSYVHPDEPNLLSLHRAMAYNQSGQPMIRTGSVDFAPTATDAFGRLRTSTPYTLFDSFHRYQDNGQISQTTSGTASSAHDANSGSVVMTVGSASGDKIYRESSRVFAYQPGKSLLVLQTFSMSVAKTGLRQRQGFFDTQNGVYIEQSGSNVYLVRRSSVSGSLKETRVIKADWNFDRFDGNGPSGATLDLTRSQIMFTDIEWLGVGSVRMGFVIDGKFHVAHIFHHANMPSTADADTSYPYMTTACLPVRAELENTAATGSPSSYRLICTSVISEGGYELHGRPRSVGHAIGSGYSVASPSTVYPIFSMRLKSGRLNGIVVPKTFSIAVTGNTNYRWRVIVGGVTDGGSWVDAGATDSSVQYNLSATSIAGGNTIEMGYIINSNQSSSSPSSARTPFQYQLERNSFTGVATEFTLCLECSTNNQTAWASVNWEEVT